MTRYGYFLSLEEYELASLVRQARMAGQAGFDALGGAFEFFAAWVLPRVRES